MFILGFRTKQNDPGSFHCSWTLWRNPKGWWVSVRGCSGFILSAACWWAVVFLWLWGVYSAYSCWQVSQWGRPQGDSVSVFYLVPIPFVKVQSSTKKQIGGNSSNQSFKLRITNEVITFWGVKSQSATLPLFAISPESTWIKWFNLGGQRSSHSWTSQESLEEFLHICCRDSAGSSKKSWLFDRKFETELQQQAVAEGQNLI